MEVHAHAHSPRKKFTHYLWEFLMLFLAVFCGFLAENFREHKIEQQRSRQFAISLVNDLTSDTAALHTAIGYGHRKMTAIDSMVPHIDQPREKWKDTLIYAWAGFAGRNRPFRHNSGTYEQMKASGSLRYFNQELTDLLNQYDVQAKKTLVREDIHMNYAGNLLNPFMMKFMDLRPVVQMQDGKPVTHRLIFRTIDSETLTIWINYLTATQSTQQRVVVEYEDMLKKAEKLIEVLKKEYHLK